MREENFLTGCLFDFSLSGPCFTVVSLGADDTDGLRVVRAFTFKYLIQFQTRLRVGGQLCFLFVRDSIICQTRVRSRACTDSVCGSRAEQFFDACSLSGV